MSKEFTTKVSMQVTKEQYSSLIEPLRNLGYEISPLHSIGFTDGYNQLTNVYNDKVFKVRTVGLVCDKRQNHIEYNPELYLALAAMTEGKDWIIGEYLVNILKKQVFKCKELYGHNSDMGFASQDSHYYRKATKEELIKHFTKEEVIMKESRFPFNLAPNYATDIINAACSTWRNALADKWGVNIVLNKNSKVTEEEYLNMRKACDVKQNELFDKIFGKDVEDKNAFKEKANDKTLLVVFKESGSVVFTRDSSDEIGRPDLRDRSLLVNAEHEVILHKVGTTGKTIIEIKKK